MSIEAKTPIVAASATMLPAAHDAIDRALAALVVVVAAVVGDIISSWLRRRFAVKDRASDVRDSDK